MSDVSSSSSSGGIGFSGLLTVLFVALKLLGKIDWAWKWVLAPAWIPLAFVALFLVFLLIMALFATVVRK